MMILPPVKTIARFLSAREREGEKGGEGREREGERERDFLDLD